MNWWVELWAWADKSPVAAGVLGTVLGGSVLALLTAASKTVRRVVWGNLRRLLRFARTARVTTIHKLEDRRTVAFDEGRRAGAAVQQAITDAVMGRAMAAAREEGLAEGYARREAELTEERSRPIVKPRWHLARESDGKSFTLINHEPDSFARDVRLDAPAQHFTFKGAARWEEMDLALSGDYYRETFGGEQVGDGRRLGVTFTVEWTDVNGDRQTDEVFVAKPPSRAYVL